jgi:hypothetical protein
MRPLRPLNPHPDTERNERAEQASAKVARFARSTSTPKPYREAAKLDVEPDVDATPEQGEPEQLSRALNEVAEMFEDDDPGRPITRGNFAYTLRRLARRIAPEGKMERQR